MSYNDGLLSEVPQRWRVEVVADADDRPLKVTFGLSLLLGGLGRRGAGDQADQKLKPSAAHGQLFINQSLGLENTQKDNIMNEL